MSLSNSTLLGLEDGQQFRGVEVQLLHAFWLKIHCSDTLELCTDLKDTLREGRKITHCELEHLLPHAGCDVYVDHCYTIVDKC